MKLRVHPTALAVLQMAVLTAAGCGGGGSVDIDGAPDAAQHQVPRDESGNGMASGVADAATPTEGNAATGMATEPRMRTVAAATIVTVPYSIPTAGRAIAIGTNVAGSVRPAEIGDFNWAYSLFNSYGTGTFVPDYSAAGAFVLAATGGHGVAPNVDAVVFDFADATWKRIRNANGVAPRELDYTPSQTTGSPYFEIKGARSGQIPSPPHLYGLATYIPAARGGGSRGSYLKMGSPAVTTSSYQGGGIHKMDLATGLWTRVTSDTLYFSYNYEATTVFDPVAGRYYFMPDGIHAFTSLQYLDLADKRVKNTPSYAWPAQMDANYQTTFLDPVRRLIVAQRPGYPLRALDLNNIGAGWRVLNTSGNQPGEANRWAHSPEDGRFYTRTNNSGQTLYRLTPPADWKNGTWTIDTVTVSGATLPNYTTTGGTTRHYGKFFYVPAIKSFAWISGESAQVVILKPPGADTVSAPTESPGTPDSTQTWTKIANEGETFTLSTTKTVRYGSGTNWVQKTLSGTVSCTNGFFGSDPAYGVVKECDVLNG